MNKIKQINISDFRIYEGTQEFQFQNANGIANLVALYAPNGYGKTSFFDAIEWGYSDKIQRLEQSVIKDAVEKEEDFSKKDKVILTNRNAYEKGKSGIVQIIASNNEFTKEVDFRTIRGKKIARDYRAGKFLSTNISKDDIKKLPETNILSQDQIDSFLRHKTPEQKFEALKEFWAAGEKTLKKYKKIDDIFKNINKKQIKLKEKEYILNDELNQIVFDPIKLEEINKKLEELEKKELFEYKFPLLKEPLTKELFESLSKELNLAEKGLVKRVKSEENKRHQLEQLMLKFPLHKGNLDVLKSVIVDIEQISEKKKFFDNLKAANKQKEEIDKQIQEVHVKLSDYRKIADNRIVFLEAEKKIKELKENGAENYRGSQRFELDIVITEKWISSLSRIKSNLLGEFGKCQVEEERFKLLFEKYITDLSINKKDNTELPVVKRKIKDIQNEIDSKNELIRKYQDYIADRNWVKETFETTDWQEKVEDYKLISDELKSKRVVLKGKNEKLQKTGSLEENLERIKLWGKEYIAETKHKNCPLCNSPFENFGALISEIDDNLENVLNISEQKKIIAQLEEAISGFENKLNDFNQIFTAKLNNVIDKTKEKNESQIKLKEKTENDLNLIQRRVEYFSLEYKTFIESIRSFLEEGEVYSEDIIPQLIERLTEKKDALNVKVERIQSILDWKHEFSESKSDAKIQSTEAKSKIEKEIFEKKNNEAYKLIEELLEKYKIGKDRLDEEQHIDTLISKNEKIVTEISEKDIIKVIGEINEKIKNSKCKIDKLELDGSLSEKERVKRDLELARKDYEDGYKKLFVKPTFSVPELEGALLLSNRDIESFNNYEKTLIPVTADLEFIEGGLRKQEIENQLKDLEGENVQLGNLKEKVLNLRNSCMSYIQNGISNYFNKDVINQIYKRIEPHPELKEIGFNAEIGNRGPRLVITAKGNTDEINPNLFLSAGQVNILSLSIFLAKAFEYGKSTISTIFMDDPIQNLSDVNILSFIDVLRSLINEHDKQIVISTHDEKFFRLLQNKLPEEYCNSRYIEFESEGKLKVANM